MVWIGRTMWRPPPQVDEGTVNSLITVIPTGQLDYPHWWAAQKKFIRRVGCRVVGSPDLIIVNIILINKINKE